MKTIALMILISIFLVVAQVSLKSSLAVFKNGVNTQSITSLAINIKFLIAIFFIILAAIAWMYVLSYEKISVVYPFMSLSYVFMIIYAHYFLGELITNLKILGVLFISFGLILLYS